jgi:hypothetical protein
MPIQTIKRAITVPSVPQEAPQWFHAFIYQHYVQLTQEVNAMLTGISQYQSGTTALPAITVGNASKTLTFTTPFTDTLYAVSALPDWATIVSFSIS